MFICFDEFSDLLTSFQLTATLFDKYQFSLYIQKYYLVSYAQDSWKWTGRYFLEKEQSSLNDTLMMNGKSISGRGQSSLFI